MCFNQAPRLLGFAALAAMASSRNTHSCGFEPRAAMASGHGLKEGSRFVDPEHPEAVYTLTVLVFLFDPLSWRCPKSRVRRPSTHGCRASRFPPTPTKANTIAAEARASVSNTAIPPSRHGVGCVCWLSYGADVGRFRRGYCHVRRTRGCSLRVVRCGHV